MEFVKKCGCKGIRTCLICEKAGNLSRNDEDRKAAVQYQFCWDCGLCWPVDGSTGAPPLYLGCLVVIPEFVDAKEEHDLVAAIDGLEWMPSQSGRRKQDFGPKVNFKKKKSKIGNFKGFPSFTKDLFKRFEQCSLLSDFRPVELCHLEYDADRGSAIEPHIDDTWIWGERLVTVNLESSTVLTLTPANALGPCDCLVMSESSENKHSYVKNAGFIDGTGQCVHVSKSSTVENGHCNRAVDCCSKEHISNDLDDRYNNCGNGIDENNVTESIGGQNLKAKALNADKEQYQPFCTTSKTDLNHVKEDCTLDCTDGNLKCSLCSQTEGFADIDTSLDSNSLHTNSNNNSNSSEDIGQRTQSLKMKLCSDNCAHGTYSNGRESSAIQDMCRVYRIGNERPNIEVLVHLPARSLVVVAGCSRHNWFHEIKRNDVASRRLAMTFRELARDFMPGGPEESIGSRLLELGQTFWEMNTI